MKSKPWREFERVVAAIHIARSKGARVTWNEEIDGRQFDVAVRFNDGLYDYLTLIECKRYEAAVPVEKAEAFVTKSRGVKANKAVMISSSGFQSGCLKVAKDNGISLLTLSEAWQLPGELEEWEFRDALIVFEVKVAKVDGSVFVLPDVNGRLGHLINSSKVIYVDGKTKALWELIAPRLDPEAAPNSSDVIALPLGGCRLTVPYELENEQITGISFRLERRTMPFHKGPALDRSKLEKLMHRYELVDEVAKTTVTVEALGLPLGFDTQLQAGKFYTNPSLGNNYVVEKVVDDTAQILLLESYVHGDLIQARYVQDVKYQWQYVEIIDPNELSRLERMYVAHKLTV